MTRRLWQPHRTGIILPDRILLLTQRPALPPILKPKVPVRLPYLVCLYTNPALVLDRPFGVLCTS